jgi:phenylalanyl-tRNA synthetase beta subunit
VAKLDLADLEAVEYVTTYRGKPLDKQSKSLTITLIFRSSAGTLTSEHVEGSMQRVIEAAQRELNASLRT